jgi:hypothetical protein
MTLNFYLLLNRLNLLRLDNWGEPIIAAILFRALSCK